MRVNPNDRRAVLATPGVTAGKTVAAGLAALTRMVFGPAGAADPAAPEVTVRVGAYRVALGFDAPIKVVSEPNEHCHTIVRYRRFQKQAEQLDAAIAPVAALLAFVQGTLAGGGRAAVTLTRLGGKALDDDNLQGAFKGVRDRLAQWLRVDDGDPRVSWHYAQEPGRGPAGVRVAIEGGT